MSNITKLNGYFIKDSRAVRTYGSVAELKADNDIKVGAHVKTKGYYAANDGGAAEYIISDTLIADHHQEQLDNDLYAEIVVNGNEVNPLQFGAKHDGVTDDHDSIQSCLNMLAASKAKILNLKGYTYLVNSGLAVDSMYKAIIKDGQLVSNAFEIDEEDSTKNFIIYGTNQGDQQPGSYGYSLEDVIFENVTFDCNRQVGLGCVYLRSYFRLTFMKCDFRRFMTYGIKDSEESYYDGHEMLVSHCWFRGGFKNEPNSTGVAIETAKPDSCYRDLIIAHCRIGINLILGSRFNQFSNIHFYGFDEYALRVTSQTHLSFNQLYFDNGGIYLQNPYYLTFTNCMWLGGADRTFTPITMTKYDGEGAYREITGVYFYGCSCHFYNPNTTDLASFPDGPFTNKTGDNVFQFNGIGFNNNLTSLSNNNEIEVDCNLLTIKNGFVVKNKHKYNKYNPFKIDDDTTPHFFYNNGANVTTANHYTYKITNNEINVSAYDNTNYTWLGFTVDLDKNSTYRLTNRATRNNARIVVFGFDSLENLATGTQLKAQGSGEYVEFETGDYQYYVVEVYNTGKYDIVINKVYNV